MAILFENFGLAGGYFLGVLSIILRYALIAGLAYFIFYHWKKSSFRRLKIQQREVSKKMIQNEIFHSIYAAFIIVFMVIGIYFMRLNGWTQIYLDIHEYGIAWLFISFFLMTLIHDTYFYWTHRLMHHPKLFTLVHSVHHQSNNPTPWAALSFHPLETIVEFIIFPIMLIFLPVHPIVVFIYSFWLLAFNVLGHLGYEIYPKWFIDHPILGWLNSSTHHNMHHRYSNCNYGFYYNFWDKWMGTNHKKYYSTFEKIANIKQKNNETAHYSPKLSTK